jgi:hypothetical protein
MSSTFGDQAGGRTNLAGRTVAALESVMVDEGLLYWMKRTVFRQSFDGGDLRTVLHNSQCKARIDPPAIDQNRTGAALAVVATLLRSGQTKMDAQRIKERSPRSERQLVRHAVDVERDHHFGWRRKSLAALWGC